MLKKKILGRIIILICATLFWLAGQAKALTLKTENEVLSEAFSRADSVINEEKTLAPEQEKTIKEKLGGKMVSYDSTPEARKLSEQKKFRFYFGVKDGNRTHAAVILEEPGKWGLIKFFVVIDLNGAIMDINVLSYSETRGRSVVRSSFLNQFIGKTSNDAFQLRKDIMAVSGATISSYAVAFVAKKAVLLYDEFYLKGR